MQVATTLLHTLDAASDEVGRLSFSPDGKLLAICEDTVITLWDIATGSLRHTIGDHDDMYFDLAFSPDSKWIAAASDEGHGRIWSTTTGELKHIVSVDDERMLSLAFSKDSKSIATGSEIMRVWDVDSGELQHTLLGPGDQSSSFTTVHERHEYPAEIWQVFFSADGKILASACPDTDTVRLWTTETWKLKKTIEGRTASFSPDAAHLAVMVGEYNSIQIYDTVNWQIESIIDNKAKRLAIPTFSPDSKVIATYSGRNIMLYDIERGEAIRKFKDPRRKVTALSFSSDGKVLLSGAEECGLRAWDIDHGECQLVLDHEDGARDVMGNGIRGHGTRGDPPAFKTLFINGGWNVAIAFPDGSVRVWNVTW